MKDMAFYLSQGFDEAAARYFASGRKRIVSVRTLPNRQLELSFDNAEQRVLDLASLICNDIAFEFLKNDQAFARVYLDETGAVAWDVDPTVDSSVVWNNKVDLDPDACYLESVPVAE